MRLTGSRAYIRPTPVPKMPPGLVELMEGLTKEVLKNNPDNIYDFCANHMEKLLTIRDSCSSKRTLTLEQKITEAQEKIRQRMIQRQQKYDKEIKLQTSESVEKEVIVNEIQDSTEQPEPFISNIPKTLVHHELDLADASELEISHEACIISSMEGSKLDGIEIKTLDVKLGTEHDLNKNDVQHVEPTAENIVTEIHKTDMTQNECELVPEKTEALENHESIEGDKNDNAGYFSKIGNDFVENIIEKDNRSDSESQANKAKEVGMIVNATPASNESNSSNLVKESFKYDELTNMLNTDTQVKMDNDIRSNESDETNLNSIVPVDDIQNKEDNYIMGHPNVTNCAIDQIKIGEDVEDETVAILLSNVPIATDMTVSEEILMKPLIDNTTKNDEHVKCEDNQTQSIIQEENITITETPQQCVDEIPVNEIKNQNIQYCDMNDGNPNNGSMHNTELNDLTDTTQHCLSVDVQRSSESTNFTDSLVETITQNSKNDDSTHEITGSDDPNDGNKTLSDPLEINKEMSELPNNDLTEHNLIHQDKNETNDNAIYFEKESGEDNIDLNSNDNVIEVDATKNGNGINKNDIQDQNNMDLETAAITIQKVFRSFLFKSRNSTFEDATNDDTNSLDEDSDKKEEYYASANPSKERRPLGITRIDTVLQTVNEEKSLSLSTDDSSTLSSAATIIQAHVRGFLVRNKLNSNKTASTNSLLNSDNPSPTSLDVDTDQHKNKTVLNIHIVPEGGNSLSREGSMITSMDLSLDGSPPSSINLHPLGYDKSERRKLKREDAVQSISPPSNNSGKLSEDVDSVKEVLIDNMLEQAADNNMMQTTDSTKDNVGSFETTSNENAASAIIEKTFEEMPSSPHDSETDIKRKRKTLSKMSSDEMDVVTPFVESANNHSFKDSDNTPKLVHSGEFHEIVLPTKVSRADTSIVRGE